MSQTKTKRSSWVGWLLSILLIAGSIWLWTERQQVVDAIQYYQYTPTNSIKEVVQTAGLTDKATFTFYATKPAIESSREFNGHCQRKEADSPILGCYSANRIYIFDISDERLKGIEPVTAAHELLHAAYERMSDSERHELQPLLKAAYEKGTNADLEARMKYYEKTEPGQSYNELHSIIGTEFVTLSPELESYYAKYFKDRQTLARLHNEVDAVFTDLSEEADTIVNQIEALSTRINASTKQYNMDTETLNQLVDDFNQTASRNGGFATQRDFQDARQRLINRSNELAANRQQIQSDVATYKTLLAKLDSINSESAELNQSLDSTLSDAPTI